VDTDIQACRQAVAALGHHGFWQENESGRMRTAIAQGLIITYLTKPQHAPKPLLFVSLSGAAEPSLVAMDDDDIFRILEFTPGPWLSQLAAAASPPSPSWRIVTEFDASDAAHRKVAQELMASVAALCRNWGIPKPAAVPNAGGTITPTGDDVRRYEWNGIPRLTFVSYETPEEPLGVEVHHDPSGMCAFEMKRERGGGWAVRFWQSGQWIDTTHEEYRRLAYELQS
jgi:hypothetical protein